MADQEKRSTASFPSAKLSDEQRRLIGKAIVDGLIHPGSFTFNNPLATEGGDYDQTGGGYDQGGGGNHNQGGSGNYNQHATLANFGQQEVTNLLDVIRNIEQVRR
jgi:hypothetical protein